MSKDTNLPTDSWLRALAPGDEVWWNDPDDGVSSGCYTVAAILVEDGEMYGDTVLRLTNDAGSEVEVYASELSPEALGADITTVRLTLDVTYELNGVSAAEMASRLRKMCERAIGEGMLTGETAAEIEKYSMETATQPEALSEDELAEFMLERIESGSLALEDIPMRLARYGLMEPSAFIDEMRERMEMASEEGQAIRRARRRP